jgi:hypothetical protein
MTKSAKNVRELSISADALAKIMGQLETQGQAIAALIDAKASTAKPAAAAQPAKIAANVPEFQMELTEGKYGPAISMTFEGRRTSRWLYVSEMKVLAKHWAEVQAAIAKIK